LRLNSLRRKLKHYLASETGAGRRVATQFGPQQGKQSRNFHHGRGSS